MRTEYRRTFKSSLDECIQISIELLQLPIKLFGKAPGLFQRADRVRWILFRLQPLVNQAAANMEIHQILSTPAFALFIAGQVR
jgi:hypothetical protein